MRKLLIFIVTQYYNDPKVDVGLCGPGSTKIKKRIKRRALWENLKERGHLGGLHVRRRILLKSKEDLIGTAWSWI